jgi:hypothetical protein
MIFEKDVMFLSVRETIRSIFVFSLKKKQTNMIFQVLSFRHHIFVWSTTVQLIAWLERAVAMIDFSYLLSSVHCDHILPQRDNNV